MEDFGRCHLARSEVSGMVDLDPRDSIQNNGRPLSFEDGTLGFDSRYVRYRHEYVRFWLLDLRTLSFDRSAYSFATGTLGFENNHPFTRPMYRGRLSAVRR